MSPKLDRIKDRLSDLRFKLEWEWPAEAYTAIRKAAGREPEPEVVLLSRPGRRRRAVRVER